MKPRNFPARISKRRLDALQRLSQADIQDWLKYLDGKLVNLAEIKSLEDVALARAFCPAIREGLFSPKVIYDSQIWCAVRALREAVHA